MTCITVTPFDDDWWNKKKKKKREVLMAKTKIKTLGK